MTTLLIDAGNTRLKWRLLDAARRRVHEGVVETSGNWSSLPLCAHKPLSVWIANVAGEAVAQKLRATFAAHTRLTFVNASAVACGVSSCYLPPQSLGVDRFMALIAAHQMNIAAPKIVVMAGTALTIDALMADGQFIGGMIVPGARLMRAALNANTANLPLVTAPRDTNIFACYTAAAIAQGTQQAQIGAIVQAINALAYSCRQLPMILLSGGAAAALEADLRATSKTDAHLTLKWWITWCSTDLLSSHNHLDRVCRHFLH